MDGLTDGYKREGRQREPSMSLEERRARTWSREGRQKERQYSHEA